MELRDAWLGSGNSLLCACLHVAPREWAAQHGSREDTAQKLSQRTRCPAASLNPPCLLKWGLLKTLSGAVRWRSAACRPQGRRCSPNVAGLMGSSHIWFPFKCPNVIKFSPTQRKSLVRCGFPPSTRVKKSLSRTPVADRRSSRPPIPPAPPRKGLCSALFSWAEGARALPARRNSRGQSSCGLHRGGEASHPGKTAAGPRLTLGTHQCLDARGLVTPCRGIPLSVAPHSRMRVHLWPASVGNAAAPSQAQEPAQGIPRGRHVTGACWLPLACQSPKRVKGQLGPRYRALVGWRAAPSTARRPTHPRRRCLSWPPVRPLPEFKHSPLGGLAFSSFPSQLSTFSIRLLFT